MGQTNTYTYDDEDRLVKATYPGQVNTYVYNGLGLRVGMTDSQGTHTYLCDGASPGAPVLSDGFAVYTPGLSEHRNGSSLYYDNDLLGNLWTVDGTGKSQAFYEDTTGFGALTASTGAGTTPFKFGGGNGCQTDGDTSLVLMGYRYYDARTGRFLTQDPAGDGDNWYAYCGNSPTNGTDSEGLDPQLDMQPDWGNTSDPGWMGEPAGVDSGSTYDCPGVGWMSVGDDGYWHQGVSSDVANYTTEDVSGPSLGSDIGSGFRDGFNAVASAASEFSNFAPFCTYDGGASRNSPGFGTAKTLAVVGLTVASFAIPGGEAESAASLGCFTSGTPVQTPNETKPIQTLRKTELVATRDPQTGKTEYRKVVRTFAHLAHDTITVQFADAKTGKRVETLTATPEHPFAVPGQGFVALSQLGVGALVVTRAGPSLVVKSLVRQHSPSGVLVYNLEVEGDHTYFVGSTDGGVWVHNDCVGDLSLEELQAEARSYAPYLRQVFGQGIKGAQDALANPPQVEGLTKRMLEVYQELGIRRISGGLDSTGVHAERLKIIEKMLGGM